MEGEGKGKKRREREEGTEKGSEKSEREKMGGWESKTSWKLYTTLFLLFSLSSESQKYVLFTFRANFTTLYLSQRMENG